MTRSQTAWASKRGQRPPTEIAKPASAWSSRSVFSNPQAPIGPQDHLAKTLAGLVARMAQRLLALTLGMFINTLLASRPPRALAAYDGR